MDRILAMSLVGAGPGNVFGPGMSAGALESFGRPAAQGRRRRRSAAPTRSGRVRRRLTVPVARRDAPPVRTRRGTARRRWTAGSASTPSSLRTDMRAATWRKFLFGRDIKRTTIPTTTTSFSLISQAVRVLFFLGKEMKRVLFHSLVHIF